MGSPADVLPMAFTYADARAQLSERRLRELVAQGVLERIGRGVYRRLDAPPADLDLVEIALRAEEATLCLASALAHHDLTDEIPAVIHVALPRPRRAPRVQAPVRWHRFQEKTFLLGRGSLKVDDGLHIGLYGAERTIIDTLRLRHQEGDGAGIEALRRWLRRPTSVPAVLLDMARSFPKVEPFLLDLLRVLL